MTRRLLNNYFSCHSKIDILRTIISSEKPQSGRQIATQAGLSPRSCQLSLDDLVRLNALRRDSAGKAYYYYVNLDNQIVTDLIIPIIHQEERLTQTVIEDLRSQFGKSRVGMRGLYFLEQWPEEWGGREESVRLVAVLKNGASPAGLERRLDQACEQMLRSYGLPAGFTILQSNEVKTLVNNQPEQLETIAHRLRNVTGQAFHELVHEVKKRPEHQRGSVDFFPAPKRRNGNK